MTAEPNGASCDVAVIGGGPAGCASAAHLVRLGHSVSVFDPAGLRAPLAGLAAPPQPLPLGLEISLRHWQADLEFLARSAAAVVRCRAAPVRWAWPGYALVLPTGTARAGAVVLASGAVYPDGWSGSADAGRTADLGYADEGVELDVAGLIEAECDLSTSMMGCFAAGSVVSGYVPTVACARGMGIRAARSAAAYLEARAAA